MNQGSEVHDELAEARAARVALADAETRLLAMQQELGARIERAAELRRRADRGRRLLAACAEPGPLAALRRFWHGSAKRAAAAADVALAAANLPLLDGKITEARELVAVATAEHARLMALSGRLPELVVKRLARLAGDGSESTMRVVELHRGFEVATASLLRAEERLAAARRAHAAFVAARSELCAAVNAATEDLLGLPFAGFRKFGAYDRARSALQRAQSELQAVDVLLQRDAAELARDEFSAGARFWDTMFGGPLNDWINRSRIHEAKDRCETVLHRLEQLELGLQEELTRLRAAAAEAESVFLLALLGD